MQAGGPEFESLQVHHYSPIQTWLRQDLDDGQGDSLRSSSPWNPDYSPIQTWLRQDLDDGQGDSLRSSSPWNPRLFSYPNLAAPGFGLRPRGICFALPLGTPGLLLPKPGCAGILVTAKGDSLRSLPLEPAIILLPKLGCAKIWMTAKRGFASLSPLEPRTLSYPNPSLSYPNLAAPGFGLRPRGLASLSPLADPVVPWWGYSLGGKGSFCAALHAGHAHVHLVRVHPGGLRHQK